MAFKKTFGAAALPVAGVSAIAVTAAIGYFVYTGAQSDTLIPKPVEITAPTGQVTSQSSGVEAAPEIAPKATTEDAQALAVDEAETSSETKAALDKVETQIADADEVLDETDASLSDAGTQVISAPQDETLPQTDEVASQVADAIVGEPVEQEVDQDLQAAQPTFDLVRIVPDGFSTVAGIADAGAEVLVMVDGVEVGRAQATASGEFVALFELESSQVPRELQLLAIVEDSQAQSASSIIVAPRAPAVAQDVTPALDEQVNAELAEAPKVQEDIATQLTEAVDATPQIELETPVEEITSAGADLQDEPKNAQESNAVAAQIAEAVDAAPQIDLETLAEEIEPAISSLQDDIQTAGQSAIVANEDVAQTLSETSTEGAGVGRAAAADELAEATEDTSLAQNAEIAAVVDAGTKPEDEIEPVDLANSETDVVVPEVEVKREPETQPEPVTTPAQAPQPRVLKADNEGVQILEATRANEVVVDAITYDPQGAVFASGRAEPGSEIRLYVNNALVAQTSTEADGQWRSVMDVETGRYILRADMVDTQGMVKSRVELPFQRENVDILAQAGALEQTAEAAKQSVEGQSTDASKPLEPQVRSRVASITVQPGNTLWGIATDTYGDGLLFARVFEANEDQIRDPDLIYPGQVFVIPE